MLRRGTPFIVAVLASLFIAQGALAGENIKFELDGYYRLRLMVFDDLAPQASDGQIGERRAQGLWMHRARLHPKLNLGERFSVNMTVNLLDNSVAGDFPELAGKPEFFSGSILPNPDYTKSFNVERVWGEFLAPIGIIRFGRMGSNWGLGILANDGNGESDDFGDTVDRVMLITKVGPIIIIPAIDKISETKGFFGGGAQPPDFFADSGSIGTQTDDVTQYILALVYRTDPLLIGAYGVYRIQPDTDSSVNVVDLWVRTKLGPVNVEFEALILNGETSSVTIAPINGQKIKASQWGVALETKMDWKRFTFGFDTGAASGDDNAGITDLDLNNYAFDRNYRIALLMFRYLIADPVEVNKTVTNAWYVKPYLNYKVGVPLFSTFDVRISLTHAQTLNDTQFYEAASFGTEIDLAWIVGLYDDRAEWRLEYGMLFPGEVFEEVSTTDADSIVHGVQGRLLIRF